MPQRRKLLCPDQYHAVMRALIDGFAIVDGAGRFLEVNDGFGRIVGHSGRDMLGMRVQDIEALESPEETAARLQFVMANGHAEFESLLRRADGSIASVDIRLVSVAGLGDRAFAFVRDNTQRKAAEAQIRRLSHLYAALGQTNQCIVRVSNREALFAEICRIVVEHGHFFMAWVGLLDEARRVIEPRNWAGQGLHLLEQFAYSADPASPSSAGPTGTAAITGKAAIHNDTSTLDDPTPRHQAFRALGINAAGAFPLFVKGRLIGTFTLYSTEAGFFTEDLLELLNEMAGDVSFALDRLESEAERKRLELDLAATNARLHGVIEGSNDIIATADSRLRFSGFNRAYADTFRRVFGKEIRKGMKIADAFRNEPYLAAQFLDNWQKALSGEQIMVEWAHGEGEEQVVYDSRYSPLRGPEGEQIGAFLVGRDITERRRHQQELEHIAHHDILTNLPNRVLLADRLHQAIAHAQRRNASLAVAYLDLDGFKEINDRHGHDIGDQLLVAVAQQMKSVLRAGDTLARIGGDEFVAVLTDLDRAKDCESLLSRLLKAVATPVEIGGASLQVYASVGATLCPQDGTDADLLIRHADQAMYMAKQAGRNCYHLFDVAHDTLVKSQAESLRRIRQALDQREFVLHYQPKVNMKTGAVIGAEALIRWQHAERGLLAPAAFLPAIEDHPISVELGEWVIDTALAQIAEWRRAGLDLQVSVNIAALQLQQPDFAPRLRALLEAHPDVPPSRLELEILETSALADIGMVTRLMRACQEVGVHFALDDFGTGYSSLTYLRRLPAERLKIDRTFVGDMLESRDDLAIVDGVVGLAQAFQREVIAEGVETLRHGEILLSLGCELGQGYGIARPMPAADMPDWVAAWLGDASRAWRAKAGSGE